MHGQYNDSKLLWKEKGCAAHMSFQSTAMRQCFSSILCASLQTYPLPHPAFGESCPCAVDQKQHPHYKGEGSPQIPATPQTQEGAAWSPPSLLFEEDIGKNHSFWCLPMNSSDWDVPASACFPAKPHPGCAMRLLSQQWFFWDGDRTSSNTQKNGA